MYPARVTARFDRVHDDDVVVSAELLNEFDRLIEHDHLDPWKAELRDAERHLGPGRIVTAGAVPDADHKGSHVVTPPRR